jgi:hypothetical protein
MSSYFLAMPNHNKANSAARFLVDNGYCRNPAITRDYIIYFLSNEGIAYMESEHTENKEKKLISVTNNFYSDVTNSQIQQFTDNSAQKINVGFDTDKLNEIIKAFEKNYENLNEKDRSNIIPLIEKVKLEMGKPNPDNSRIKKLFGTVKNILEGVAGNIIAAGLLHYLSET